MSLCGSCGMSAGVRISPSHRFGTERTTLSPHAGNVRTPGFAERIWCWVTLCRSRSRIRKPVPLTIEPRRRLLAFSILSPRSRHGWRICLPGVVTGADERSAFCHLGQQARRATALSYTTIGMESGCAAPSGLMEFREGGRERRRTEYQRGHAVGSEEQEAWRSMRTPMGLQTGREVGANHGG